MATVAMRRKRNSIGSGLPGSGPIHAEHLVPSVVRMGKTVLPTALSRGAHHPWAPADAGDRTKGVGEHAKSAFPPDRLRGDGDAVGAAGRGSVEEVGAA